MVTPVSTLVERRLAMVDFPAPKVVCQKLPCIHGGNASNLAAHKYKEACCEDLLPTFPKNYFAVSMSPSLPRPSIEPGQYTGSASAIQ